MLCGQRFDSFGVEDGLPAAEARDTWPRATGRDGAIDRDGRWWYPTAQGLARYPAGVAFEALATTLPERVVRPDRLTGRDIFRLYEDHRADVWISTLSASGLARWDRETGPIRASAGVALSTPSRVTPREGPDSAVKTASYQ